MLVLTTERPPNQYTRTIKIIGVVNTLREEEKELLLSAAVRLWGKNLCNVLNAIPVESKRQTRPKVTAIISTSVYFDNAPKKFKKPTIKKECSHGDIFDGRNSLSRYINVQGPTKHKALIDLKCEERSPRDTSYTKVSKIEYQVRQHWLKRKYMKQPGLSSLTPSQSNFANSLKKGFMSSFKTEISEQSCKNEEGDTRNTSKEYDKCELPQVELEEMEKSFRENESHLDNSFAYADVLNCSKSGYSEAENGEARVSEKMTTRVYKTFANNLKKMFRSNKTYGWNWGNPTDPKLNWWKRAEGWLKYAFQGSAKTFSEKDKKVFQELTEMDWKKESKSNIDNDDRIPLTGNFFKCVIILVWIENDLKRTFPNDKFFQSSEAKKTLFNVLKAYNLYDNKWGYVQGMNFIAASLVYHSSAEIAFWLFVSLIFDYQLRENYKPGFPGVKEVNAEIEKLLELKWPKVFKLFKETDTDFGMLTLEIIMSLFGTALPLSVTVSA